MIANSNYPSDSTGIAYKATPFVMSDDLSYWQDINVNISKKFSKNSPQLRVTITFKLIMMSRKYQMTLKGL